VSLFIPLAVTAGNDENFYIDLTLNGKPVSLANLTPVVVRKASATADDGTGTTYTIGSGITILDSGLGKVKLTIPHAGLAAPGTEWWRCDLVDGLGTVVTALYGPLYIKAA